MVPVNEEIGVNRNGVWTGLYGMIHSKVSCYTVSGQLVTITSMQHSQKADMIMRATMISPERMTIARHCESLFFSELSVLSTPSTNDYATDVLVHFKRTDQRIYLALIVTSLLMAVFLSLALKIKFISSLWLVLKASMQQRK